MITGIYPYFPINSGNKMLCILDRTIVYELLFWASWDARARESIWIYSGADQIRDYSPLASGTRDLASRGNSIALIYLIISGRRRFILRFPLPRRSLFMASGLKIIHWLYVRFCTELDKMSTTKWKISSEGVDWCGYRDETR